MERINLDANAMPQLRDEVHQVFNDLRTYPRLSNASSVHRSGAKTRQLLRECASAVKKYIDPKKDLDLDLFFTSGGTEGCNTIIEGFVGEGNLNGFNIVSSYFEHPASSEALKRLQRRGAEIIWVKPKGAFLDVSDVVSSINSNTLALVISSSSSETGAIQPLLQIAKDVREANISIPIVSDVSQFIGRSSTGVGDLLKAGVDAISFSGNKLGVSLGIGVCIVNKSSAACRIFNPLIVGGPQQGRYRAGTENHIGALALKKVLENVDFNEEQQRVRELKLALIDGINQEIDGVTFVTNREDNADSTKTLSNTIMLGFSGVRGDDLVVSLDLKGIDCSTGSACSSGKQEVSQGVKQLGLNETQEKELIRLSLDWNLTKKDIAEATQIIKQVICQMRSH